MQSCIVLLIEYFVEYGDKLFIPPAMRCSGVNALVFLLLSYNFSAFSPVQGIRHYGQYTEHGSCKSE